MTDGIRKTIKHMTGTEVDSCPWRAFFDPFVQRVQEAAPFYDKGQLAMWAPNASHRLMEGLAFFERVGNTVRARMMELELAERKRAGNG
jgi:hypothetical protein